MAGTLPVSFLAAQRANFGTSAQVIGVSVGDTAGVTAVGTAVGTFTPATIDYASFSTTPQLFAACMYELMFEGVNPLGRDNTAYLDAVTVTLTSSGGSNLADNPFGYLGGLGYWQDPALADTAGSGLSYVRQRWLENATGQWLSVDPVASEPRYGYARNMPTSNVDANGTQTGLTYPPYDGRDQSAYLNAALDSAFHGFISYSTDPATYTGPFEKYKANKQAFLMSAEHSLRSWVESQPPGRAAVFSAAFAVITGSVPFIPHIPNSVLAGMDRWFGGPAGHAHRQKSTLSDSIMALLPPAPGTAEDFQYKVGFLWGVLETLVGSIDVIDFVGDLLNFAVQLFQLDLTNLWPLVCEAAQELIKPLLDAGHAQGKAPYDRGKIAGILITSLILLVILIINLVDGVSEAVGAGKVSTKLARLLKAKGASTKNAIVAGLEMQKRLSAKGITADSTINKLRLDADFALKVAKVGLTGLSPLTRGDFLALMREIDVASSLADLKVKGMEVRLVPKSHIPREFLGKPFPISPAAFDVGPQSAGAFIVIDDRFFTLSRLEQRAVLAHEVAHLEQWAEIVRLNGGNFEHAYAMRMRLKGNSGYHLIAEINAQQAALRAVIPDWRNIDGLITPAIVQSSGASDVAMQLKDLLDSLDSYLAPGTEEDPKNFKLPSEAAALPFVRETATKIARSLF